jgi:hypothetical protein
VGFGKHFHITVPEKLGLALIMNFFELHFKGLSGKNSLLKVKGQSQSPNTLDSDLTF